MKNIIATICKIIVIALLSHQQINSQSKKIESLTSFNSIFRQKIVRISDRFVKKFETKNKFLQLFYYNVNLDIRWTSNNKPKKVIGMDGAQEAFLLLDDGFHFDNNIADGIYANFHFRNWDELMTAHAIFDVCCMDSLGIVYSILSPPVKTVPDVPQIIFPQQKNKVFTKRPTIKYYVGNNTDNSGIILLDEICKFGEIFQHLLWEKEMEVKDNSILEVSIPYDLTYGKEYALIVWSSNNHFIGRPETSQQGAYSMEYITFRVDTTVVDMSFRVFQNYPNPFNNWTAITWTQAKEDIVRGTIYNIQGEEVKSILSNKFSSGKNTTIWDGTDNKGNKVSSGIYFLTIRLQNQVKTIKIVYKK